MLRTGLVLSLSFLSIAPAWAELEGRMVERFELHWKWCLTHHGDRAGQQGITLFRRGTDYDFVGFDELRTAYATCQAHNDEALWLLERATDREIRRALDAVVPRVEDKVKGHLEWIADEREQAAVLLHAVDLYRSGATSLRVAGDLVRHIYMREQAHNLDAQAQLKAVSDGVLLDLAEDVARDELD